MKTIKIYQLAQLSPTLFHRLKAAQMEAAQVWNVGEPGDQPPLAERVSSETGRTLDVAWKPIPFAGLGVSPIDSSGV